MKRHDSFQIILCLVGIAVTLTHADPAWHPAGLDGHTVNSIVVNNSGGIIAGTDKGLYIQYQSREWLTIPVLEGGGSLPVEDVIVSDSIGIIVAAGNGTRSDGIYKGDAIWGPPYYALRLIDWIISPQALTKTISGDSVFVGTSNSISYTTPDSSLDRYAPLKPIKIPPYSFGVEMPLCAALHVFSDVQILFAGGYDRSPLPGQGHLLWLQRDSMTVCSNLNVSAMVEGCTNPGGPYIPTLYIGTVDDGIYAQSIISSSLPTKYLASPNDEMILAMMTMPSMLWNDVLSVAVRSGVYVQSGTTWTKLGTLPVNPLCLAKKLSATGLNGFALYAGTSDGVYVFDSLPVGIGHPISNTSGRNRISVTNQSQSTVAVSFSATFPGQVSLDVLDCTGKLHKTLCARSFSAGDHVVTWHTTGICSGMYIIRLVHSGMKRYTRFVVTH